MSERATHSTGADMEARVEALEYKLMHAEDHLESLNLALYRQQQVIERLHAQVKDLKALVSAGAADPRRPEDDLPPH